MVDVFQNPFRFKGDGSSISVVGVNRSSIMKRNEGKKKRKKKERKKETGGSRETEMNVYTVPNGTNHRYELIDTFRLIESIDCKLIAKN